MPTERSLLALRRSVSQAGRRRFDPGRPLSWDRRVSVLPLRVTRRRWQCGGSWFGYWLRLWAAVWFRERDGCEAPGADDPSPIPL